MEKESSAYCRSATLAIELLQGKWTLQILCVMRTRSVRLGQLRRLIPEASTKVLTENLRKLETAGLVVRRDLGGQVRHVEYGLVEPMSTVTDNILDQLAYWGKIYRTRILAHPATSPTAYIE